MSDATWYYATAGRRLGPFTADQLRQLAAAGAVRPPDLVWDGDPRAAVPAAAVPGLFPADGAAAPGGERVGQPPAPAAGGGPGAPAVRPSPVRRWAGEYAAVGAVGAGASLFSPDLASAGLVGGLAAGLMCFAAAGTGGSSGTLAAVGLGLLGAAAGAAGGAATFAAGLLPAGLAAGAAVGGAVGAALGYAARSAGGHGD